jgi:hypothetical protein
MPNNVHLILIPDRAEALGREVSETASAPQRGWSTRACARMPVIARVAEQSKGHSTRSLDCFGYSRKTAVFAKFPVLFPVGRELEMKNLFR